jgi:hypothetical protein
LSRHKRDKKGKEKETHAIPEDNPDHWNKIGGDDNTIIICRNVRFGYFRSQSIFSN